MISLSVLLTMRNVSDKRCRKKSEHIFYVQKLISENRAIYEIILKNMVETDRPQMTYALDN